MVWGFSSIRNSKLLLLQLLLSVLQLVLLLLPWPTLQECWRQAKTVGGYWQFAEALRKVRGRCAEGDSPQVDPLRFVSVAAVVHERLRQANDKKRRVCECLG